MKSLNQISFIDSSGNEIKLDTKVDKIAGTVPIRDASGRFRVGDTSVSSTDGYVVINKNYADGRISTVNQAISAEVTARQNAINALNKSDSAVVGQFVSAVSETNGIISVTRRAIVDGDGVVLKTGDQTISGIKTFAELRCSAAPSIATDVVRRQDISRSKINVTYAWDSIDTNASGKVTWTLLTQFLANNNWTIARLYKIEETTFARCSCQIGYQDNQSGGLINSIVIEIPEGFASHFGNKTRETFTRGTASGSTVIDSQFLPYLQACNLIYDNPW